VNSKPEKPVLERKRQHARGPEALEGSGYLAVSRSAAASILFMMPLLLLYEIGIWQLRHAPPPSVHEEPVITLPSQNPENPLRGNINAIAGVAKGPLFVFGRNAMLVFNLIVVAALVWALRSMVRRPALRWWTFPLMLLESAVYALALMVSVSFVLRWQLAVPAAPGDFGDLWRKSISAAGAGVYEEFVFRGAILYGFTFITVNVLRMQRPIALAVSILAAAAVFSAAHFITPGEATDWITFRFRFVAGVLLSLIVLKRGLGVAIWSHAIYDVWAFCLTR